MPELEELLLVMGPCPMLLELEELERLEDELELDREELLESELLPLPPDEPPLPPAELDAPEMPEEPAPELLDFELFEEPPPEEFELPKKLLAEEEAMRSAQLSH